MMMPISASSLTAAFAVGKLVANSCRTFSTVKRGIIGNSSNSRKAAALALGDSSNLRRLAGTSVATSTTLRSASAAAAATLMRKKLTHSSQAPSVCGADNRREYSF